MGEKRRIGTFRDDAARRRYLAAYDAAMRACPPPEAEHDVDTAYGPTRVYRFGTAGGPPLVLLPGFVATSACWALYLPALARERSVYTVDSIGEPGRSVQTAPLRDHTDRARWLGEVLDALGCGEVHLVGGSTGGYYAIRQAIHAPDRLASVSLLDPTMVSATFSTAVLWRMAGAMLLSGDWAWRRALRYTMGVDPAARPDTRLVLAGIREFRLRLPPQSRPDDAELREVRTPALAVFGGSSVVHDGPKAATRMRALVPHAEVELWQGITHDLPVERSAERVLDFVRDVDERAH